MGLVSFHVLAQSEADVELRWADSVMHSIQNDQRMDFNLKSDFADSISHIYGRHADTCKQVYSRTIHANYLDKLGMADSALVQLYWASTYHRAKCDSNTLMAIFVNLTNVYLSLGEFARIDSVSRIALALWNPSWKERDNRFSILNNLAIAQASRGDMDAASKTFRQVYREAIQARDTANEQTSLINLGSLKGMTGDLDSAYYFLAKAAHLARRGGNMNEYMDLLINLSNVDMERGRYKDAISRLDTTFAMATELKSTEIRAKVQKERASLYARMLNFKSAFEYLTDYIQINDQYLNEQRIKAVTEMMEKYESEKKARQIQKLELDNLDAALKNERITNARNRYLLIGIIVFLAALGLWSRLNFVRKSRSAIQKEKDISEGLLLNILPASVAEELKQKGYADAQHFDLATILFSDFKEFTTISEQLSPAELVEEINVCFKAFDDIMTQNHIEKIKTIGDAYMAAGGLPDIHAASTLDVVKAALEMQRFILARKRDRDALHRPAFDMRIGIHSGPVVAGIFGVKKFQYDIWGDTVNIASRMESNSEIGRVNISEATYQLIKDHPDLQFTQRGMIHAKGKGDMAMYFVDIRIN